MITKGLMEMVLNASCIVLSNFRLRLLLQSLPFGSSFLEFTLITLMHLERFYWRKIT